MTLSFLKPKMGLFIFRTERFLSELLIQHAKTTSEKYSKMTYAASEQPGNLRVNGIQPETKHNAVMTAMMIGAVFVSLKINNAEPS